MKKGEAQGNNQGEGRKMHGLVRRTRCKGKKRQRSRTCCASPMKEEEECCSWSEVGEV